MTAHRPATAWERTWLKIDEKASIACTSPTTADWLLGLTSRGKNASTLSASSPSTWCNGITSVLAGCLIVSRKQTPELSGDSALAAWDIQGVGRWCTWPRRSSKMQSCSGGAWGRSGLDCLLRAAAMLLSQVVQATL